MNAKWNYPAARGLWAAVVALGLLNGCGPRYDILTCVFAGSPGDCAPQPLNLSEPGQPAAEPRDKYDLHFTVVNPARSTLGCDGDVDFGVNSPRWGAIQWYAEEKDHDTCAVVGPPIEGERALTGGEQIVDVHFPSADFTFRFVVRPAGS